jgi:hypothetical protein
MLKMEGEAGPEKTISDAASADRSKKIAQKKLQKLKQSHDRKGG